MNGEFMTKLNSFFLQIMQQLMAISWALTQAILTMVFLPSVLSSVSALTGIFIFHQAFIVYFCTICTAITIYGLSYGSTDKFIKSACDETKGITEYIKKPYTYIPVFLITFIIALGYLFEWKHNLLLILHVPHIYAVIICSFATLNWFCYSFSRSIKTIDSIFDKLKSSHIKLYDISKVIAVHVFAFAFLGVIPFNLMWLGVFSIIIIEYFQGGNFSYNGVGGRVDDLLNQYVFLILHCASEGAIVAAGIGKQCKIRVVKLITLLVATLSEECQDMVHADDEAGNSKNTPKDNLCSSYYNGIFRAIFSALATVFFTNQYFYIIIPLASVFAIAFTVMSSDDKSNTYNLFRKNILKDLFSLLGYITAFSVGVNGGLEFMDIIGTNLYIALILALTGTFVESAVYSDNDNALKTWLGFTDDTNDHEHNTVTFFANFSCQNIIISLTMLLFFASVYFLIAHNFSVSFANVTLFITVPAIIENIYIRLDGFLHTALSIKPGLSKNNSSVALGLYNFVTYLSSVTAINNPFLIDGMRGPI